MLRAGFDSLLSLVMFLVFTGFAVAALVFAAMAREDAYRAAEKQTKKFWLIVLGINLALNLLFPMLFLQIAGVIAAIVFMVDVRPALQQVSGGGGGRRGGGSSSDGPYGPYNGGR
ncbi:DUF2516 family protein [Streptomyces sp. NPDC087219]|uniref:DUF2516 family protein n=1 Tax=unclassified Streptomyces TaxID=2593676 RepID=UPI0029AAEECA|nr:DUF2516 family protein [Streptomyces sp. TX20-6-3]MDX2560320.1 DUF2516 family protein [Streptomyces sp. TX20-6-3]